YSRYAPNVRGRFWIGGMRVAVFCSRGRRNADRPGGGGDKSRCAKCPRRNRQGRPSAERRGRGRLLFALQLLQREPGTLVDPAPSPGRAGPARTEEAARRNERGKQQIQTGPRSGR